MSRPYDYEDDQASRRRSSSHVRQYSPPRGSVDPDRDLSPPHYSGGAGAGGPYASGALPQSAPYYPPPPNGSSRGSNLQVPRDDHRRPRAYPSSPTSSSLSGRGRELDHYRGEDGAWDDDHDHDHDHDHDRARGSHRSRTPLGKAREVVDRTFSQSSSGLGAGVLGAIVGGLVAREASEAAAKHNGHGHGKHDKNHVELLSTIVGAAVGGLGANALEKRIELSKKKGRDEQSDWEKKWGNGNGSHRDRSRARDGERDRDRERSRDRDSHRDGHGDRSRADRDRDLEEGRRSRRHGERDYSDDVDDDDDYVHDARRSSRRHRSQEDQRYRP